MGRDGRCGRANPTAMRAHPTDEAVLAVTAPHHARTGLIGRHAALVAEDPVAIELMLRLHALRENGHHRQCGQCRVRWPCVPWQAATLARTLSAASSSPGRTGPGFWFHSPHRGPAVAPAGRNSSGEGNSGVG